MYIVGVNEYLPYISTLSTIAVLQEAVEDLVGDKQ